MKWINVINTVGLLLGFSTSIIAGNCSLNVAANPLDFGIQDIFSLLPIDNNGSIVGILCSGETIGGAVVLTAGLHSGGNFFPRYMKHEIAPDLMPYNLYTDATYANVWGDGNGNGTSTVALNLIDGPHPGEHYQNITIYGRVSEIPPYISTGVYWDTVEVDLIFNT